MKTRAVSRKTATKECPDCNKMIPVACKSCTCGHLFKRGSGKESPSPSTKTPPSSQPGKKEGSNDEDSLTATDQTERPKRQRLQRTREKPDYIKRPSELNPVVRRRIPSESSSTTGEDNTPSIKGKKVSMSGKMTAKGDNSQTQKLHVTDGKNLTQEKEKEKAEDIYATIPPEKALQYAIILGEINRKYAIQNFKPV